jgi:hypothetical protein
LWQYRGFGSLWFNARDDLGQSLNGETHIICFAYRELLIRREIDKEEDEDKVEEEPLNGDLNDAKHVFEATKRRLNHCERSIESDSGHQTDPNATAFDDVPL